MPFFFAALIFLPFALFLVIIILLGSKLELIAGRDASIIALIALIVFLAAIIYFQGLFRKTLKGF